MPSPSNPQSWNRYSYVSNNPLRYTDPTGHMASDDHGGGKCDSNCLKSRSSLYKYKKTLGNNGWDLVPTVADVRHVVRGLQVADAISSQPGFADQQAAFQNWHNNCYGQCHYANYVDPIPGTNIGGPMPSTPIVDSYSEAMGETASGAVNLGLQTVTAVAAAETAPVQGFAHGGSEWHVGLETTENMKIVHVGNHAKYGVHIAFGAVRPYAANLHIYMQSAFPFFRIWKP